MIALLPEQWSLLFTSDPATIAACVGWLAIELGQGLDALFWAMGIGLAAYGIVMGGMLLLRPWQARISKAR